MTTQVDTSGADPGAYTQHFIDEAMLRFAFPLDTIAPPYVHRAVLIMFGVLLLLHDGRPRPVANST